MDKIYKIKKGLDIPIANPPEQKIYPANPVSTVALIGKDYIWRKGTLMVRVGDRVKLGQPVVHDRKFPNIVGTSPGSGIVEAIHRGPKRALNTFVIRIDNDDHYEYPNFSNTEIDNLTAAEITEVLTSSGLWAALRSRPYSTLVNPTSEPYALFITAIDSNPLAPDPALTINASASDFLLGVKLLSKLVQCKVYVCQSDTADLPVSKQENVSVARFAGPHPAGLVGTHIHLIAPVNANRSVWHIGYQDVIAIAVFFRSGRRDERRIVSLAGPAVIKPRLIQTRLGACTNDLVKGELDCDICRVISGPVLSGNHAAGTMAYLGRYHNQITVLSEATQREFFKWMMPGRHSYSATRLFLSSLLPKRRFKMTTQQHGSARALIPIGMYERVMPLDILATPLLRSIVIKDIETAQALGCLELDEEDLALCSFVDPGKFDFGPLLRESLYQIYREG